MLNDSIIQLLTRLSSRVTDANNRQHCLL